MVWISFPKMVTYLETHSNFATIKELAAAAKISRRIAIETLTAFGQRWRRARKEDQIFYDDLNSNCPPEEVLYFFPPVDGVLRISEANAPRQLEQAEFDAIWGMLLFEKKIDLSLTSAQLNVPKYHLLRAIYKILATTPMKLKFAGTSVDLLEEKDLSTFFEALKKEFSRW